MPYMIMKVIHIFAVIMFVGNLCLAFFWKSYAEKTKDINLLKFTFAGIRKADRIFTMPGVTILILFGIGGALHGGFNLLTTSWILWSEILIVISGGAYMAGVVPVQKKITALTDNLTGFNWEEYNKLSQKWSLWALFALISPIIAIVLMTLKLPN